MKVPRKKILILIFGILGIGLIGTVSTIAVVKYNQRDDITVSLFKSNIDEQMSSSMIETDEIRIYIDPYSMEGEGNADYIFLTHPHGDHYDQATINKLKTDTTVFIVPASCTDIIEANEGTNEIIEIAPNDTHSFEEFSFEAIPAYNINTFNLAHNKSFNWCGYILTIGDYTIMQTGDTSLIPEYEDLEGEIDVLIIPIGWGCSNMGLEGAMDAIEMIQPTYVLPIHYGSSTADLTSFQTLCRIDHPNMSVHPEELILT